jgi:putative endonuclease
MVYNSCHFNAERGICCSAMREYKFSVYIMASRSRVLYTGITNDLVVRVFQHKIGRFDGFTKKYRVHRLVYFESFQYVRSAIAREKEIKHWTRKRRVELVESMNPTWEDLATGWYSEELLANPDAPAVIKYDPAKVHGVTERKGNVTLPKLPPERPVQIKFWPSQIRTFGHGKRDGTNRTADPPLRG